MLFKRQLCIGILSGCPQKPILFHLAYCTHTDGSSLKSTMKNTHTFSTVSIKIFYHLKVEYASKKVYMGFPILILPIISLETLHYYKSSKFSFIFTNDFFNHVVVDFAMATKSNLEQFTKYLFSRINVCNMFLYNRTIFS